MDSEPETKPKFPWVKILAIGFVIAAALYGSQHPHTFMAELIKMLLLP